MSQLSQIIELMPSKSISFASPIRIEIPASFVTIHEVIKSPANDIYLRVCDGDIFQLEEKDRNFNEVARCLIENLKTL